MNENMDDAAVSLARRAADVLAEAFRVPLYMFIFGLLVGLIGLVIGLIVGLATEPPPNPNDWFHLWVAVRAVIGGGIGFAAGALGFLGWDLWDRFRPEAGP